MKAQDRTTDFTTILLHGELLVLPCAHLDALLERWMGDDSGFVDKPLYLIDEVIDQRDMSWLITTQQPQHSSQGIK